MGQESVHPATPLPRKGPPPPLPPRNISREMPPPTYSEATEEQRGDMIAEQLHSTDPRSSSMHSLVPSESSRDGRRTLLLIYIHGFMGNETSFQSFPAHVHNLLAMTLAETHVVHTKIYPKYKSRRAIEFARDDFSDWLEPHEGPTTDVIFLGHSMGGLLSAEVVLLPPISPTPERPFQHRILGTVSFDTPFLGMHPGIIGSGISSLFRPAPEPPGPNAPSLGGSEVVSNHLSPTPSITSSLSSLSSNDPNYNPPFVNDVNLPQRSGWSNMLHFINKHSDGLAKASKEYFMSHIEFGGCLADFAGLRTRYNKLRELEDVDDYVQPGPPTRRIRFVNYYTASTGIPKKPKTLVSQIRSENDHLDPVSDRLKVIYLDHSDSQSGETTPRISIDEFHDAQTTINKDDSVQDASPVRAQMQSLGEASGVQEQEESVDELPAMRHIDSMPIDDNEEFNATPAASLSDNHIRSHVVTPSISVLTLPAVPAMPVEPTPLDVSQYPDKDARKLAEKDYKRAQRAYQQAVKDRENAIKDRRKLAEKREKKVRQERDKALKAEEKQRLKEEKEEEKRHAATGTLPIEETENPERPKKDRKFCLLPGELSGKVDKCWIRVYMEGVDEVGAHCGLFFPGPQYESLVGDVGARIEGWVQEDALRKAIHGSNDL